jgi:glycosyltransferase involved in cell wall biosynthesis
MAHRLGAMEAPTLSAVVLCYRAEESIRLVIEPLYEHLSESGHDFELVLVANYDEGAVDRTPDIARAFTAEHDRTRVIAEPKRGGMGWDMRSGLAAARGGWIVVIDGDSQNPVEDVLRMYEEMRRTGAPVMKGRRIARFDGLYRRVVSLGYNTLFVLLFQTRGLSDINGKPKGLTRAAYERMRLTSDDWFIDAQIVLEARRVGLPVVELPVVFRHNNERASFVRFSAIFEFVANMLRARLGKRT